MWLTEELRHKVTICLRTTRKGEEYHRYTITEKYQTFKSFATSCYVINNSFHRHRIHLTKDSLQQTRIKKYVCIALVNARTEML